MIVLGKCQVISLIAILRLEKRRFPMFLVLIVDLLKLMGFVTGMHVISIPTKSKWLKISLIQIGVIDLISKPL